MIPIFQRVTDDDMRLVLAESDSIMGLADLLGVSVSSASRGVHRAERGAQSTYQVTWVEEDEDDDYI